VLTKPNSGNDANKGEKAENELQWLSACINSLENGDGSRAVDSLCGNYGVVRRRHGVLLTAMHTLER
jgi:hypothetical protein